VVEDLREVFAGPPSGEASGRRRGGTIAREESAMTIDVDAVYEDGVLKPERPLALKEKAKVRLIIEPVGETAARDDDPTGWKAADELIGFIQEGPKGPIGAPRERGAR
jgi:predicted DNA-binding antitoxin AbrB/MazE fold protein